MLTTRIVHTQMSVFRLPGISVIKVNELSGNFEKWSVKKYTILRKGREKSGKNESLA